MGDCFKVLWPFQNVRTLLNTFFTILQVASVITKWKSNTDYSYGYVRAEVLAGFINGLFLIFISFFIFSEAVERLVEPPEVKHERLLPVSIAGFFVNIVGIVVFQHGG